MGKHNTISSSLGQDIPHDSALKHAMGEALYVDDIPEPVGTLHLAPGSTDITCGAILDLDLNV